MFSLKFREMDFWWARKENVWAPPKKLNLFSPYQTTLKPIFFPLFSILLFHLQPNGT